MSTGKIETQPTKGVRVCTWTALAEDEDGDPFFCGDLDQLTMQATGTFDGETGGVEGSMDGTNWFPLTDRDSGSAVGLTAAGLVSILERPLWVRPTVTLAAAGTVDIDVIISGVELH